jgi:uncharacterized membrane protein
MISIILILFYLGFPALIIYSCNKFPFLNKLGAILLTYAFGLLIGNLGILPNNAPKITEIITTISIPLALPFLLFSSNVQRWSKLAKRTFLSMIVATVALLVVVVSGFYLFHDKIENAWQIAGMAIGVYSGGTPNMAAIGVALHVDSELYIMTNTSDMVAGAVYLLFFLSIAQRVYLLFLPKFKLSENKTINASDINQDFESYDGIFKKKVLIQLAKAMGIAILIFALAGLITLILPENSKKYEMAIVILTITGLGILVSFIPSVRKLEKTFQMGMYLILVFSLAIASQGNISKLLNSSPYIFYFIAYAIFGTAFLHMLLSTIFRIDADTTIIVQVAYIMSPPFVPAAAAALRNRDVILSGIIVGIIGYAIGNFMGVTIAYMLK